MKLILCFIMVLFFACDDGGGLDFGSQEIMTVDYGTGAPCGGSVMNYNGAIYRNYDGGVAPLDADLQFIIEEKLGSYTDIYHAEVINGNLWFSIVTYDDDPDYIKVFGLLNSDWGPQDGGLFLHGDEAIPMVAGTFVVFDPRVPHSASEITTDKKRMGIDFTVKKYV